MLFFFEIFKITGNTIYYYTTRAIHQSFDLPAHTYAAWKRITS